jgi:hypothetical protein
MVQALEGRPSTQALAFVTAKVSDKEFGLGRTISLTKLGNSEILQRCEQIIRCGTEFESYHVITALRQRGTPDVVPLLEIALQSGCTPRVRRLAAQELAFLGVASGEKILESDLSRLQGLKVQFTESGAGSHSNSYFDFVDVALSLADINNRAGLLAIKEMIDTQASDGPGIRHLRGLTLGILDLEPQTTFSDWRDALERWIEKKLAETQPVRPRWDRQ